MGRIDSCCHIQENSWAVIIIGLITDLFKGVKVGVLDGDSDHPETIV